MKDILQLSMLVKYLEQDHAYSQNVLITFFTAVSRNNHLSNVRLTSHSQQWRAIQKTQRIELK